MIKRHEDTPFKILPIPLIARPYHTERNPTVLKYCLQVVVLLGLVLSANAKEIPADLEGVELYDWLLTEGLFDPLLDNKSIHEVLVKGLYSHDEDVTNAAINAIGWYVVRAALERRRLTKEDPVVERDLQDILGLRKLLLDRWNREYDKNPEYISEITDSDQVDFYEMRNDRYFMRLDKVWMGIPETLALLYPTDMEIAELTWKAYDDWRGFQMLIRLDESVSRAEQNTHFRIEMLWNNPHSVVVAAVRGLGLFQSDEGLAALVMRLKNVEEPTDAIAHIIEAIVAHGEKALPFANLLRHTAETNGLVTEEQLQRPAHYNSTHTIGRKYRVQIALQKLKEFEDAQED